MIKIGREDDIYVVETKGDDDEIEKDLIALLIMCRDHITHIANKALDRVEMVTDDLVSRVEVLEDKVANTTVTEGHDELFDLLDEKVDRLGRRLSQTQREQNHLYQVVMKKIQNEGEEHEEV